jgi:hypothetical protein
MGPDRPNGAVQAFLDSLVVRGATPIVLPGEYNEFSINGSGVVDVAGDHGYWNERDFALTFPADPATLDPLLDAFGDSLSLSVSDDRGGYRYRYGNLR